MESLRKHIQLIWESSRFYFWFLLYINDLPNDVICGVAIYADDTTLYSILLYTSLFSILNLNLIYETLWTGVRSGLLISMLEKLSWFCLTDLITMDFSSNWIGVLTLSLLVKLSPRKLEL